MMSVDNKPKTAPGSVVAKAEREAQLLLRRLKEITSESSQLADESIRVRTRLKKVLKGLGYSVPRHQCQRSPMRALSEK